MHTDKTNNNTGRRLSPPENICVNPCSSVVQKSAFTIVEALLSALLLAIGAVVVFGITNHCLKNSRRCIQYETAYQVMDDCLERALDQGRVAIGQLQSAQTLITRNGIDYQYKYQIQPAQQQNLYSLAITVTWQSHRDQYEISTSTLIYAP